MVEKILEVYYAFNFLIKRLMFWRKEEGRDKGREGVFMLEELGVLDIRGKYLLHELQPQNPEPLV